ncbi:hypothetical protein MSAN_01871700 [Mycena sanguinolenta]|uniref:Uncharacterized protein n=1 Tax=Mycena sanguinolenta TaxID=230812 RepID=A0A8H7CSB0_9AGAR|nr:hypothetical protein MSAN_01871700 [Mycena sanguinolenta]
MDIDEIPGLGGSSSRNNSSSSFYGSAPDSQMPSYTEQVVISPAESSFSAAQSLPLPQNNAPPPSSADSGSTASATSTTFALEQNSTTDTEQLPHHHRGLQRRGIKTPDRGGLSGSRNGHNHHHHHHNEAAGAGGALPHPLKRKMASFASVSGHRKLVIDLSDSEGEGEEDFSMHEADWDSGSGSGGGCGAGRSTPPVSATPATLMEKEQQIRKMRELIAQREMSRKQKAMSRSATTASNESSQREEAAASVSVANGSITQQQNGFHLDGTTPIAVSDKCAALASSANGSTSSPAPATPPHIDPDPGLDEHTGPVASTSGTNSNGTTQEGMSYQPSFRPCTF